MKTTISDQERRQLKQKGHKIMKLRQRAQENQLRDARQEA